MAEPLTREERAELRELANGTLEHYRRDTRQDAVARMILRLLDEREALAAALDDLTATVEDASAELAEDFRRPRDLACELGAAVRRARAKSEGR